MSKQRSFKQDKVNVIAFAQQHGFSCFATSFEDVLPGTNGFHIGYHYTDGDELTFYVTRFEDFIKSDNDKAVLLITLDLNDTVTDPCQKILEWRTSRPGSE